MTLPALHGNWVDFVIILFVLFYLWDGWGKGFIQLTLELIVFVASFTLGLKLYPYMANLLVNNFSFPQGLAKAIGFFALGLVFEQILANIAGSLEAKIPERIHRHRLNTWFSLFPLLGNALVILAFILTLALGLPIQGSIKSAISKSKLGSPVVAQTQALEKTLSAIFGEALSDTFNFITIPSGPVTARDGVKLNFTQRELVVDEASETEMLVRVNKERRDRGLAELVMDPKLRDLSRVYARDMFERGYFSHYNPEGESPFDRMEKLEITYTTAGENLALAPNVTIAHQGLMDSPGHRENILNPEFGKVGIGVIDGGIYGKMFVQEFTD